MLIKDKALQYKEYAIELRRRFHQYPEEGRKEFVTSRMIREELSSMGIASQVLCETGLIADIGEDCGHTACIRSDIDGLQVKEETGSPYESRHPGYMHACGHDAHMAMALTAARILKDLKQEGKLRGRVRLLFEPGEENSDGALDMIRAGALDGVDTIYGTHIWAGIPSGQFSADPGPRMASTDFFKIYINGKSTHGSLPHKGVDPIMTAASIMQNIQVAFGREFPATETALVSFCQIHGGNTDNAIPEQVTIGGTTRAFLPSIREQMPKVMERVIRDTAHMFRAEARLEYGVGCPAVINEEKASALAARAIAKNFGHQALTSYPATTGGEDFSEFQNLIPGVFVFLGIDDAEKGAVYPNHNSRFSFDEEILWKGAAAAVQYCLDYLEETI